MLPREIIYEICKIPTEIPVIINLKEVFPKIMLEIIEKNYTQIFKEAFEHHKKGNYLNWLGDLFPERTDEYMNQKLSELWTNEYMDKDSSDEDFETEDPADVYERVEEELYYNFRKKEDTTLNVCIFKNLNEIDDE